MYHPVHGLSDIWLRNPHEKEGLHHIPYDTRLVREYPQHERPREHSEHVAGVEDAEEVVVLAREAHLRSQRGAHDAPVEDQVGVLAA